MNIIIQFLENNKYKHTFDICIIIFITRLLIPGRAALITPVSQNLEFSKADNCALKNNIKCSSSLHEGFLAS